VLVEVLVGVLVGNGVAVGGSGVLVDGSVGVKVGVSVMIGVTPVGVRMERLKEGQPT
jgi:hypothetical protein